MKFGLFLRKLAVPCLIFMGKTKVASPVVFIFLCGTMLLHAQQSTLDSLKSALVKYEARKKKAGISGIHQMDTAKVHLYDALAFEAQKNFSEETLGFINAELKLAKQLKFKDGIADAYNVMGMYYGNQGDLPKALACFENTLVVRKQMKDPAALSFTYMNIGTVYSMQGNYTAALYNIVNATEMAAKAKNSYGVASGYNNMAVIYKAIDKPDEALASYIKALRLFKELKDIYNIPITQFNIGSEYLERKQYAKAMQYFTESLQGSKLSGNKDGEANIYIGIGNLLKAQGKYKEALVQYTKAYEIRKSIDAKADMAASEIEFGRIYTDMQNYTKAIPYLERGLKGSKETGSLSEVERASEVLAEAYAKSGNYKSAYENMVLFKDTHDSIFSINKDKKLTELRLTYEFNKKQDAQKALQQKKDAAVAQQSQQQRSAIYAAVIALVVVSFFAFWINHNLQRNKKQKKIIEAQNEKIQQSLSEKETLLREIHHRVKNNLQIISSLLNIQSENIEDKNLLSSIREGQSRVQAMSLIHQNLYQSEQVNNVDIENYLKELVVYLSQMFNTDSKKIETAISTDGIQFDIDTAIPLGLIVNELVSNAYKYAFENRENGRIRINIKAVGDDYELHIDNDGRPLPTNFDINATKSLGLKLVSILSRQLRGKFSFESDEQQTSFMVSFRDLKTLS